MSQNFVPFSEYMNFIHIRFWKVINECMKILLKEKFFTYKNAISRCTSRTWHDKLRGGKMCMYYYVRVKNIKYRSNCVGFGVIFCCFSSTRHHRISWIESQLQNTVCKYTNSALIKYGFLKKSFNYECTFVSWPFRVITKRYDSKWWTDKGAFMIK